MKITKGTVICAKNSGRNYPIAFSFQFQECEQVAKALLHFAFEDCLYVMSYMFEKERLT